MKLNGTPRHYMPLSQTQSDDEDSGTKGLKFEKHCCKKSDFDFTEGFNTLKPPKISVQNKKCSPMSPLRTLVFLFSLCICVMFIAIFVLLLPCKSKTIGVRNIGDFLEEWTMVLPNISFTSNVALAVTSHFSSRLLVFGYIQWENESLNTKGVMAVRKSDGEQLWKLPLHSEPTSVICNSIDVNNDGCSDCLIIGRKGLMTAVDTRHGRNLWFIHSHRDIRVADNISVPTVLPDCDGDTVPDLAVSYAFSNETRAVYLSLISGGTGQVIGSPILLVYCSSPVTDHMSLVLKNQTVLVFYCPVGVEGNLFLSHVQDICDVALNRSDNMKLQVVYRTDPPISSMPFQMVSTSSQELVVVVNGMTIALLSPTLKGKFRCKWQKTFGGNSHWHVATYGSYLDGSSNELVLISSKNVVSKVIGLKISTGHRTWSRTFNNSIITTAFTLQKFFRDTDGIVLKMLTPASSHVTISREMNQRMDSLERYIEGIVGSENNEEVKNFTYKGTFVLTEERFTLVHVADLPRTKKLSVQNIWQTCNENTCKPDLFTKEKTAVAVTSSNGEVDMSIVSTSVIPSNSSVTWRVQTYLKLLKIEKFSKFTKCMYEIDS